jgi:hypothetical protein
MILRHSLDDELIFGCGHIELGIHTPPAPPGDNEASGSVRKAVRSAIPFQDTDTAGVIRDDTSKSCQNWQGASLAKRDFRSEVFNLCGE